MIPGLVLPDHDEMVIWINNFAYINSLRGRPQFGSNSIDGGGDTIVRDYVFQHSQLFIIYYRSDHAKSTHLVNLKKQ